MTGKTVTLDKPTERGLIQVLLRIKTGFGFEDWGLKKDEKEALKKLLRELVSSK